MAKASFHQSLLDRRLREDPMYAEYLPHATFKHHGMSGETVTVMGVWVDDGTVMAHVADDNGKMATVVVKLFLLEPLPVLSV